MARISSLVRAETGLARNSNDPGNTFFERGRSKRWEGIKKIMDDFRARHPKTLGGSKVVYIKGELSNKESFDAVNRQLEDKVESIIKELGLK